MIQLRHEALAKLCPFRRIDKQVLCTAVLCHAFKLLVASTGGERGCNAACAQDPEKNQSVIYAAGPENRYRLPRLKPGLAQLCSNPFDIFVKCAPANFAGFIPDRERVWLKLGPLRQNRTKIAEFSLQTGQHFLFSHGPHSSLRRSRDKPAENGFLRSWKTLTKLAQKLGK